MLGKLCYKKRSHMLYHVACMACIVCMTCYVASTRIALCTCEIMHYVACIYCIVCTNCTCCIRLHISSACPLTYTCTYTGCMWLWVSVFCFVLFFYKLIVFYIMVYIEVYFCQSASNFNMTVNFTFIFIFFPNIEDKGNFGLVTSH